MTNPRFSAAFFDLDGTLIDTGPPHVEAERATIKAFGFDDLAEDHPVTFGQGVKTCPECRLTSSLNVKLRTPTALSSQCVAGNRTP